MDFTRRLTIEMVSGTKIRNKEIRENCDWKTNGEKGRDGAADEGKKTVRKRAGEKTWKINGRITRRSTIKKRVFGGKVCREIRWKNV